MIKKRQYIPNDYSQFSLLIIVVLLIVAYGISETLIQSFDPRLFNGVAAIILLASVGLLFPSTFFLDESSIKQRTIFSTREILLHAITAIELGKMALGRSEPEITIYTENKKIIPMRVTLSGWSNAEVLELTKAIIHANPGVVVNDSSKKFLADYYSIQL